jgi:hypothetical protein
MWLQLTTRVKQNATATSAITRDASMISTGAVVGEQVRAFRFRRFARNQQQEPFCGRLD